MKKILKLLVFASLLAVITIAVMSYSKSVEQPNEKTSIQTKNTHTEFDMTVAVAEIITTQLLENAILNIEITPHDDKQNVAILLQSNEFIDEDTLLKNSYNILNQITKIEQIEQFTFHWYMLVKNKNTEVLTLTFSREVLDQISQHAYRNLPEISSYYKKHDALE